MTKENNNINPINANPFQTIDDIRDLGINICVVRRRKKWGGIRRESLSDFTRRVNHVALDASIKPDIFIMLNYRPEFYTRFQNDSRPPQVSDSLIASITEEYPKNLHFATGVSDTRKSAKYPDVWIFSKDANIVPMPQASTQRSFVVYLQSLNVTHVRSKPFHGAIMCLDTRMPITDEALAGTILDNEKYPRVNTAMKSMEKVASAYYRPGQRVTFFVNDFVRQQCV